MQSNGAADLKVVDVYHGDGTVDFGAIKKQGYDGVIIKATQGTTFKDSMCAANYDAAKRAGLHAGFYHYYNIENYSGVEQALFFLRCIEPFASDYLPAIDVELIDYNNPLPNPTALSAAVKSALDTVKNRAGGSMFYSNPATMRQLKASALGSYPLWIAEYGVDQVKDVTGFGPWTGWQFTPTPMDESVFTDKVFLTAPPPTEPVLDYQEKLIRLKIGGVQPTGIYDSATKSGVMSFQRIGDLTVDGVWGSQCESAYAAIAAKPLLKTGSMGIVVRYVQFCVLADVDGVFGSQTAASVRRYQKEFGLMQDGVVGPATWGTLIG